MRQRLFHSKILATIIIFALTAFNVSCTKEKAEAIKSGAEQFRVESKSALNLTEDLLKQSVAVSSQTKEEELKKIAGELNTGTRTDTQVVTFISTILTPSVSLSANRLIETEFNSLEEDYDLFESIFRSLPRGRWLAKDAVAKAERHGIKLTLRFIKMADTLQKNPIQFTSRRADIGVRILESQKLANTNEKNQAMLIIADQLLLLRNDEQKANDAAILQCLKAAESGKLITELIRHYSKFAVSDMLDAIKDALNTTNAITGGTNTDVKAWVSRYNSFVNNKIRTDALWNDVLTTEVRWTPTP